MAADRSGRSTIERLFDKIDNLRDTIDEVKDGVREQIAPIAEKVAVLIDDRDRASRQRQMTYTEVSETKQRVAALEQTCQHTIAVCADMRKDIDHLSTIADDYEGKRVLITPALNDIAAIKSNLDKRERQELYDAGVRAVWGRLGAGAKAAIAAVGTMVLGVFGYGITKIIDRIAAVWPG